MHIKLLVVRASKKISGYTKKTALFFKFNNVTNRTRALFLKRYHTLQSDIIYHYANYEIIYILEIWIKVEPLRDTFINLINLLSSHSQSHKSVIYLTSHFLFSVLQ